MDFKELNAAQVEERATVERLIEEVEPIESEQKITVTQKNFDPRTGKEVAPSVQVLTKRDLDREKGVLLDQIAKAQEQVDAIDVLLQTFPKYAAPIEGAILETPVEEVK